MFENRGHQQPDQSPKGTAIVIPESELRFETARSGGPGGQNVNKVETKVRVLFNLWESRALTSEQKRMIFLDPDVQRATRSDGMISLVSQEHRSQGMNKKAAIAKLHELLERAAVPEVERIATEAPPSVEFKRQRDKEARSRTKQQRRGDLGRELD